MPERNSSRAIASSVAYRKTFSARKISRGVDFRLMRYSRHASKRLPGIGDTPVHQREVEAHHSTRTEKWASEFWPVTAPDPGSVSQGADRTASPVAGGRDYYQDDLQAIGDPLELRLVGAWPNAPPDPESTGELGARSQTTRTKGVCFLHTDKGEPPQLAVGFLQTPHASSVARRPAVTADTSLRQFQIH
jgi:hypothetical protein